MMHARVEGLFVVGVFEHMWSIFGKST